MVLPNLVPDIFRSFSGLSANILHNTSNHKQSNHNHFTPHPGCKLCERYSPYLSINSQWSSLCLISHHSPPLTFPLHSRQCTVQCESGYCPCSMIPYLLISIFAYHHYTAFSPTNKASLKTHSKLRTHCPISSIVILPCSLVWITNMVNTIQYPYCLLADKYHLGHRIWLIVPLPCSKSTSKHSGVSSNLFDTLQNEALAAVYTILSTT